MKKRILSILLCLCMAMSIVSIASAEEPVTLTMFIDHSWYPVESFTGIIPDIIKEKTGVTLDVTVALNAEQLGVMMASDELPDLVYTQNMIDRMSDGTLCCSYEELIAEYCPDWEVPAKMLGIARNLSEDGVAYTLMNHYSEKKDWENSNSVPMVGSLLLRGDILDALGEKQPTSFDELYDLFGKVKAAYPDMTPLRLNSNWNTIVFRYLKGIGGLDFILQDDGSYIHYSEDPRNKEILLWLNKCYQAGYLIADDPFFVNGSTAIPDDKWFASCGCTQNNIPSTLATLQAINPEYYAIEMTPFAEADYLTTDTGWSGTFITKNCSNKEAAIKLIRWMFTEEGQRITQMGREGIEYTLNEQGLPEFSQEWKDALANGEQNTIYNTWFYLGGSEIVEADSRCATTDPKYVADCYKVIRERFDNLPWIMAALPKGESDEKIVYTKVQDLFKTYEAKVIMAATTEEAEKTYDEYLDIARNQIGLGEVDTFMKSEIERLMPMFQ